MAAIKATEDLIREALEFLPPEEQVAANSLHKFALSLGLKIEMRKNLQKAGRGYYLEYSTKKPKRKLFYIHTHEQYKTGEIIFKVKANLFNIDNYAEIVEKSPLAIKEFIKGTGNCLKCRTSCYAIDLKYTIDGTIYDPCYGQGHYFQNLDSSEWERLKEIIANEYNVITVV